MRYWIGFAALFVGVCLGCTPKFPKKVVVTSGYDFPVIVDIRHTAGHTEPVRLAARGTHITAFSSELRISVYKTGADESTRQTKLGEFTFGGTLSPEAERCGWLSVTIPAPDSSTQPFVCSPDP